MEGKLAGIARDSRPAAVNADFGACHRTVIVLLADTAGNRLRR
jgi:hypothetical protein